MSLNLLTNMRLKVLAIPFTPHEFIEMTWQHLFVPFIRLWTSYISSSFPHYWYGCLKLDPQFWLWFTVWYTYTSGRSQNLWYAAHWWEKNYCGLWHNCSIIEKSASIMLFLKGAIPHLYINVICPQNPCVLLWHTASMRILVSYLAEIHQFEHICLDHPAAHAVE